MVGGAKTASAGFVLENFFLLLSALVLPDGQVILFERTPLPLKHHMHRFGSGQAFLDFVWGEDDGDLDLEGVDAGPASLPFELDSMQIDESGEATEFEEESEEKEEKEPAAAQSSPPAPLAFARLAQPAVASNCCTICEEEMSYLKSFGTFCFCPLACPSGPNLDSSRSSFPRGDLFGSSLLFALPCPQSSAAVIVTATRA